MVFKFFKIPDPVAFPDVSIDWPAEEDPAKLSNLLKGDRSCSEIYLKKHLIHKAFEKRAEIATITEKDFIVFKAYPEVFSKVCLELNGSFKLQPDLKTLVCSEFKIKLELVVKPTELN